MTPQAKIKIKLIALLTSFLLIFYLGTYYQLTRTRSAFMSIKQIRAKNNDYPLVNRLVGTEIPSATSMGLYTDAKSNIQKIISKKEYSDVSHFSLYFRDLNTGLWFGVDEDEEYIPASLFKVPIAITYFRNSVDDKDLLDKRLAYSTLEGSQLSSVDNLDQSALQLSKSYSVKYLIEKMLVDSDNGAQRLLANNISQIFLDKLYSIIEVKGPAQNHFYISPKEYAFFLRMLYNGSYLGLDKSEQLLEMLAKTSFPYGIQKGVPSEVTVIHKFGSINFKDKNTGEQKTGIHDCGIVYYTDRPYVLCIMTEGGKQLTALEEIEEVSSYLYNYTRSK